MNALALAEVRQTAEWIASLQLGDGMVPWYPGAHADPWNHVEATMALAAGGRWAEVRRAFEWLAAKQLPEGSWCAAYVPDGVIEPRRDPNTCAYVATGAWWCAQLSQSASLLEMAWPMVRSAVSWCLRFQRPGGEITWSVDPDGVAGKFALLTASSSLQHSLACAARMAEALGHEEETGTWRKAAARLARAVATRPAAFAPKQRWAMDWYYPVLTGALAGDAATRRMQSRWAELVVPGCGTRCVADKVWITAAESAECSMAATRAGLRRQAADLLSWTRHFRANDGGYWTGCVHPDCVRFPAGQKSTYSAAAVIIADHVLHQRSPAAAIFSAGGPSGGEPTGDRPSDDRPSDDGPSDDGPSDDGPYDVGDPSASTAASSSLAARRPEPMHAGTPTPL
jgi:hypothetical protein